MKRKRYSVEQIVAVLKQAEMGKPMAELPQAVYRLSSSDDLRHVIEVPDRPNGLAFSSDGRTFYLAVTGDGFLAEAVQEVRAYDLSADGTLSNERLFHRAGQGAVDGIAMNEDGCLWCSTGDGVEVVHPDGAFLRRLALGRTVANLCFGGRANARLFICAGDCLLSVFTNVRGLSAG